MIVESMKACNFIKKRLQDWCFPLNIAWFIKHLWWLLLNIIAAVSARVLSVSFELLARSVLGYQKQDLLYFKCARLSKSTISEILKLWVSFFSKCPKFKVDSKNEKVQKVFGSLDSCIWNGKCEFSLLWQDYTASAVNVLLRHP